MAAHVVNNVQQLLVKEEEVSTEQQECSSSLSHQEQETCVFKREEEVSTTLSFTPVHEKVKYEEDGESLISSSIKDIKTEADENKCGGPGPDLNSILLSDHQRSLSSESDTDDSEDWRETSISVKNRMVAVSKRKDDHKSLICSECGKNCTYESELKMHMQIHTGEKPYICSQCGKGFISISHLNSHVEIHTEQKPSRSVQHIKTEADEIKCGGPEQDFNSILLSDHQRSLSSESDTDDSEDWRETSNPVKNRMVAVSKEIDDHKSLTCSECGRKCPSKSHLNVHMRIHTGEKPYICSHCGKGFTRSSNLKTHVRTHTGEKTCFCSNCGKCFISIAHMKSHMKLHGPEVLNYHKL